MFQCSPFKLNRLLPDHNVIATSDTFMEAEETFLVYNWVTCNHNNQINQVNVYTVMQSKYNAWYCVLFAAVNHFPPVLQLLQQFFGSIVTVALLIQGHDWSCTIGTLTLIILLVFTTENDFQGWVNVWWKWYFDTPRTTPRALSLNVRDLRRTKWFKVVN